MVALLDEAPLLEVQNLAVSFWGPAGEVRAVDGVSFSVGAGEIVALVGESGSGKTVTALSLLGLLPRSARVTGGEARYGRMNLLARSEREMEAIRGRHLAMVLQEPMGALNPVLTVGQQVVEVLQRHAGMSRRVALTRAVELFQEVGLPHPNQLLHQYPHQLSGGMCQRVLMAQALAGAPRLLIADEPTTALDMTLRAQVRGLLARLRQTAGLAVLLITHDLGAVAGLADRVVVMYAGQVMEAGPTTILFANPVHPYTQALLAAVPRLEGGPDSLVPVEGQPPDSGQPFTGCPFHPRCTRAELICRTHRPAPMLVRGSDHMAACWLIGSAPPGRFRPTLVECRRTLPALPAGIKTGPVLSVNGLVKHFTLGSIFSSYVVRAVDGVSFELVPGQTLALVGESGCGKTTLGRSVLRLYRPTAGEIRFLGTEIGGLSDAALAPLRRHMGAVFQDPSGSLNPRMGVAELIAEPLAAAGAKPGEAEERVRELLALVGLGREHAARRPHQLSGGQRQRVGIARALALSPRLVVADEPVSALDVSVQAQIINLLADLKQRLGLSYLFITHDLALCRYLADRVAVMYQGRLVETGPTAAVLREPIHPYTWALLSAIPRLDPAAETQRVSGITPAAVQGIPQRSAGCRYHAICPMARAVCTWSDPSLRKIGPEREVACHYA